MALELVEDALNNLDEDWTEEQVSAVPNIVLISIPIQIKQGFWEWYEENQNDTVLRKAVLGLLKVKVKLRDLRFVFVLVFGQPPE